MPDPTIQTVSSRIRPQESLCFPHYLLHRDASPLSNVLVTLDEDLEDLQFLLRPLVSFSSHHDYGGLAALCDDHRIGGGGDHLDYTCGLLSEVGDGDDLGDGFQVAAVRLLVQQNARCIDRFLDGQRLADLWRALQTMSRKLEAGPQLAIDTEMPASNMRLVEVVANCDHLANLKFSAVLPRVFTEHGAVMAANVLQSDDAIEMSVFIVRAFVRLRQALTVNVALARRLEAIERRLSGHDEHIEALVTELRKLLTTTVSVPNKHRIGFRIEES